MKGNGMDLLVSFDTTGSMYPVLAQVRTKVANFISEMFNSIDDLRVGIIAHGDYCDKDNPYTIRIMDFTNDESAICDFVNSTEKTYGGDADECYELVLNCARTKVNWLAGRKKVFILIGDAAPHSTEYPSNKDRLDWRNEAKLLGELGVKIFGVHALSYYRSSSKQFYETIAKSTSGIYLTLDNFSEIKEIIKATSLYNYSEKKLDEYVSIIKEQGKATETFRNNINRLKGIEVVERKPSVYRNRRETTYKVYGEAGKEVYTTKELIPVNPGRFQAMEVIADTDIKGFVMSNGIEFKRGRGFYELTKSEKVQQYKEIIIQNRETGEMFTGAQVRIELGLKPQVEHGGVTERLSSHDTKKYRVFVQSTSVNRKLIGGTAFLYEVSDIEDTGTTVDAISDKTDGLDSRSDDYCGEVKFDDRVPEIDSGIKIESKIKKRNTNKKKKNSSKEIEGKKKGLILTVKKEAKVRNLEKRINKEFSKIQYGDSIDKAREAIKHIKEMINSIDI